MRTEVGDLVFVHTVGTPTALKEHARDSPSHLQGTPFVDLVLQSSGVIVGTPRVAPHMPNILERWLEAWSLRSEAEELERQTTTLNILRERQSRPLDLNPPSAWQAAQQLRSWLGVTFDDLSAITGIGTSTFHSWKNSPVVPRPSKVRGLWRLFTLAKALQSRLGSSDAAAWLRSGNPSPLHLLLAGQVDAVEEAARNSVLRPQAMAANPFMSARIEDRIQSNEEDAVVQREPGTMRRASRPIKRGRPRTRD